MNQRLQIYGLLVLGALGLVILFLVGWVFYLLVANIDAQGRVPSSDAFGFAALLLAFREVVSSINGLWRYEERVKSQEALAASTPAPDPVGKTTVEGEDGNGPGDARPARRSSGK